ncbi:MAG: ABC transporter substrate-binding protein [Bacilli bacterium]|nr:ABC transporter substrate-binding protein [Bacilli bacterium]MDD4809508.1 ABC transporter substrate-binding protein [Bacilli bacterium]
MKRLVIFLLLVIIFLTGCGKKENTIVMVTEAGFAPYEYYENGKVIGVDIDIAKEIAKHLGKELIIKDIDFDSIINELNSGKADFALAGMSITEERKKEIDFSIEYSESKQVIVALKDSNIKTVDDLKNKKIVVQLGSVADIFVSSELSEATVIQQKKFLSAAQDVKSGKADCLIMDALPANELVKNNKELSVLSVDLFTDRYAVAVAKGNEELLDEINKVLDKLMENGKIEEYILYHTSR